MNEQKRETSIGVVIPAFNEEAGIEKVVNGALEYCQTVLVVDDGSGDATAAAAQRAGACVLRQDLNLGKGAALKRGFVEARNRGLEAVIAMDGDGQHDPRDLPRFIEAYRRTAIPVLIGNRMIAAHRMPLVRRVTNRIMSWMLSNIMRKCIPDTQCGFRLYRCDILPFVSTSSERFAAESEVLLNIAARGIRMDSVHVHTIYDSQASSINPVVDTYRFFAMLLNYKRRHRRKG